MFQRGLISVLLTACYAFLPGFFTSAYAEEPPSPYTLILRGESLMGYSDISGSNSGDFNTSNDWLVSLGYKIDPTARIIAMYNGNFLQSNLFVLQEEGSREATQLMTNNFSLMVQKELTPNLTFQPRIYYDLVYLKETNDESLGDGLYDYTDIGGGFEMKHRVTDRQFLTYGFGFFSREYPHFSSLLSLFDPNSTLEENEKDFLGYQANVSWKSPVFRDVEGALHYTALFKDFSDKRTIDSNGIRTGSSRRDFYQEFRGTLSTPINDWVGLGLVSALHANLSNLDFYDTRNTASLGDDRFSEDYFDYYGFSIGPHVNFTLENSFNTARPVQWTVGYEFSALYYPGREAQNVSGVLKGEGDQNDYGHLFFTRLSVPLSRELSWITRFEYKTQNSNQDFESFYLYDYETWSIVSGLRFER